MEEPAPAERPDTPLERLSIDDLKVRIAALRTQIAECERLLGAKEAQRAAADALFGGAEN